MSKTPAQLWVEALRSGEYKQGKNLLRTDDCYCCLGVACDLYQKHVGGLYIYQGDMFLGPNKKVYYYEGCDMWLPDVVRRWLGLNDNSGDFYRQDRENFDYGSLAEANDAGKTFEEIADLIESRPKGLFHE